MKNKFLFISLSMLLVVFITACNQEITNTTDLKPTTDLNTTEAISVYTTVYPLTYFTERIGGDFVQVQSIYPANSNEHTFEPTQKDMMALADADLFFYIGLGLEGFVKNAQKTLVNEEVTMISTSDTVADKDLLTLAEDEDEHEEEESSELESHSEHDHGKIDPHLWLSPKISVKLALSIKESLIKKDPQNEAFYKTNYENLVKELNELDSKFTTMSESSENKLFFVSHAAFGYLAKEYSLEQTAVAGLNSQDEPSQKELTELVQLAKEKQIKTILFEQNVSSHLSKVIQKEIGAKSLTLHNLSVLTNQDLDNKETYFSLMEQNLFTLQQALNSSN